MTLYHNAELISRMLGRDDGELVMALRVYRPIVKPPETNAKSCNGTGHHLENAAHLV